MISPFGKTHPLIGKNGYNSRKWISKFLIHRYGEYSIVLAINSRKNNSSEKVAERSIISQEPERSPNIVHADTFE